MWYAFSNPSPRMVSRPPHRGPVFQKAGKINFLNSFITVTSHHDDLTYWHFLQIASLSENSDLSRKFRQIRTLFHENQKTINMFEIESSTLNHAAKHFLWPKIVKIENGLDHCAPWTLPLIQRLQLVSPRETNGNGSQRGGIGSI